MKIKYNLGLYEIVKYVYYIKVIKTIILMFIINTVQDTQNVMAVLESATKIASNLHKTISE